MYHSNHGNAEIAICVAAPATQIASKAVEIFGIRAAWLHFANTLEVRRLAKLHGRIIRRKASLDELLTERQLIMNRCIRRMPRHQGKN